MIIIHASVYNIHNEIKLKWYTKNADQTYYFCKHSRVFT